ncbi:hypothetical protein FIBSPDRAFT_948345 [Athelia psychrophila]|uniref:Uncharacterized protein n=1 Tax=Athelia psychrophila TaxID=1759441 RepID=A0A166R0M9_9AGAM|nr:hypothetical protein FIBSPDRAFT_948345 [Fibularhizoctonia sp. CBS 109695]
MYDGHATDNRNGPSDRLAPIVFALDNDDNGHNDAGGAGEWTGHMGKEGDTDRFCALLLASPALNERVPSRSRFTAPAPFASPSRLRDHSSRSINDIPGSSGAYNVFSHHTLSSSSQCAPAAPTFSCAPAAARPPPRFSTAASLRIRRHIPPVVPCVV